MSLEASAVRRQEAARVRGPVFRERAGSEMSQIRCPGEEEVYKSVNIIRYAARSIPVEFESFWPELST